MIPLIVIGLTPTQAAYATLLSGLAEFFYHWNVKTPHWVGYIMQRPESHCVHHQRGLHRYNYGDLPLWDMLFGTFHNPRALDFVGRRDVLERGRLGRRGDKPLGLEDALWRVGRPWAHRPRGRLDAASLRFAPLASDTFARRLQEADPALTPDEMPDSVIVITARGEVLVRSEAILTPTFPSVTWDYCVSEESSKRSEVPQRLGGLLAVE